MEQIGTGKITYDDNQNVLSKEIIAAFTPDNGDVLDAIVSDILETNEDIENITISDMNDILSDITEKSEYVFSKHIKYVVIKL